MIRINSGLRRRSPLLAASLLAIALGPAWTARGTAAAAAADSDEGQDGALTRVGQQVPGFTVTTLDGMKFDTAALKGKVIVLSFWATWCAPCQEELPRLDRELWQVYRGDNFALLAIAREQSNAEIGAYQKRKHLNLPMAADPRRAIYSRFATEGIPRTFLIGADGRILYQTFGYMPSDFGHMKDMIRKELGKTRTK
jgi:peroxiredoxin